MESKKATTYKYNVKDSASRIDEILNANDNDYEDNENNIPSRGQLTYKNGYYVNVTALFIDIVGSSKLTDGHRRPTLAKMYRAFLSECVAIMNSWEMCKEININGDCVWGVFETPYKSNVDDVISVAAQLSSMIKILNYKLKKKKYNTISVGIGIDDGLALMVKAGYSGRRWTSTGPPMTSISGFRKTATSTALFSVTLGAKPRLPAWRRKFGITAMWA